MQPRTRPTRGTFAHDYMPEEDSEQITVMFPGPAARGVERIQVHLSNAKRISESWFLMQARLKIEGIFLSDARPIMVFWGVTDIPSGVCFFPMMGASDTKFGGIHSLTVRCVA